MKMVIDVKQPSDPVKRNTLLKNVEMIGTPRKLNSLDQPVN